MFYLDLRPSGHPHGLCDPNPAKISRGKVLMNVLLLEAERKSRP